MELSNIVYMNGDQAVVDRLEVESNIANLFRERVETRGKQVRSACRTAALWVTLGVSTWFLADMGLKIYTQQIQNMAFPTRFLISALNLLVFLGGFAILYTMLYHTFRTFVGYNLFSRGEYFERKDSTYLPLYYKVDKGYYVDMYFQSNGYISKVSVPQNYAANFEVGSQVPVAVSVLMYKQSGRVRVVTNCVGSRADNSKEYQESLWRHSAKAGVSQEVYEKALGTGLRSDKKLLS